MHNTEEKISVTFVKRKLELINLVINLTNDNKKIAQIAFSTEALFYVCHTRKTQV